MSSNIGEALLNIKVDITGIGTSQQRLLSFFNGLTQMASGAAAAVNGLGTAFTSTTTSARTLAQNVTLLNTALNGTAAATSGAARNQNNLVTAIQRGVDIARLGEAANRRYAESLRLIEEARNAGRITPNEFRRGNMNIEKQRRQEIFAEALGRSKLNADPVREHFNKRADDLSRKVVSGALSAERAIAQYNREVRKMGVQGAFASQQQKIQTLRIMTEKLTAAQEKYNATQRAKSVDRGIALADPRQAAQTKLAGNVADINAAMNAGRISAQAAAAQIAKLNGEFRKSHSAMGMFESRMESIGFKTSMFSSSLRTAGRQLLMFSGVIAAAITPAVVASAKFEQAVQNVAAVLDGIGDKTVLIKDLSAQFLDLGERSEFTAIQVAEAARELAKAGFSAKEVQGSLEGVVSLASAAGISLKDAAEVAANLTRAFQLPAESFGTVADKLVAMANKSTAEISDLAAAFKYVSPIASAFGQSIDDVGAALVVLANTGNTGSRAGTGLSRFFSELVEPRKVAKLKALLESVGESVDQISPDENSMRDIFALLDRLMDTKKIQASDLSAIFDQRSARAVMAILGQGIEEFDEAKDVIANGSAGLAEATRDARLDTLIGDWLKFTSALNTAMIKFGDTVNNPLRDALQYLTGGLRSLTQSFESSSSGVLGTLASLVALAAGAGVLVTALGAAISVFGAFALSISVVGGPITATIAVITALAAALTALAASRQFEVAKSIRQGLKEINNELKDTTKVIRETSKQVDDLTIKLGLLRNLSTLKPIQIQELFKGEDPFGIDKVDASVAKLDTKIAEIRDKRKELEAAYEQTLIGATAKGRRLIDEADAKGEEVGLVDRGISRMFQGASGFAKFFGIGEGQDLAAQIERLTEAEKQSLGNKDQLIGKQQEIIKSLELSSLTYSEAYVELQKTNEAIEKQKDLLIDLTAEVKDDPTQKDKLERETKILGVMEAESGQLKEQQNAGLKVNEAQRELAQEKLKYIALLQQEAPVEALAAQAAAVDVAKDKFAELANESRLATQAVNGLTEATEKLKEMERERAEEGMTEGEKKLSKMTRDGFEELALAEQIVKGAKHNLAEAEDAVKTAELKLSIPTITVKDAGEMLNKLPDLKESVKRRQRELEAAERAFAAKPMELASAQQDFADKTQVEQADKVLDLTQKAALAVAQKTHNMKEELALTQAIAERELERSKNQLREEGAGVQEITAFDTSERERIKQEIQDLQDKYTKQFLDDIDKANLEIAKKTNNLKEELRITEKLRMAEIDRKALEIDPAIRQQWIDAQKRDLGADLDEIRRKSADKSPVKSQLSQIENRSDDVLKKRVENQDKIRDALAQQVKTMHDAHVLNSYLFKLERARETMKEQARMKALADARRLQNMVDRGANPVALSSQFSRAAASLDSARSAGVSNLALSPAAITLAGLPTNIPAAPARMPAGNAGGTNINSNNHTLTIEKGAIVINDASDSAKVAAVVIDTIKDMLSGKGPRKGK